MHNTIMEILTNWHPPDWKKKLGIKPVHRTEKVEDHYTRGSVLQISVLQVSALQESALQVCVLQMSALYKCASDKGATGECATGEGFI